MNVGFVALWLKVEKVTVCKVEDGVSALTLSQADSKCRFKFTTITMTIRFIVQPIFLEQLFGAKDTGKNKAQIFKFPPPV